MGPLRGHMFNSIMLMQEQDETFFFLSETILHRALIFGM